MVAQVVDRSAPTTERIHRAALILFAQKGFAGTGIRELADTAGLSSASLYNHIGTKDDLLVRIVTDGHDRLLAAVAQALAGVLRPERRLARLVQVHVTFHAAFRLECQVIDAEFGSLHSPVREQVLAQRDAYEALWSGCLDDGVAEGVLRVADVQITRLALLSMVTGVAHWYRPDGAYQPYDLAGRYVDLALGAVQARRNRRPLRASDVDLLPRSWFDQTVSADLNR